MITIIDDPDHTPVFGLQRKGILTITALAISILLGILYTEVRRVEAAANVTPVRGLAPIEHSTNFTVPTVVKYLVQV